MKAFGIGQRILHYFNINYVYEMLYLFYCFYLMSERKSWTEMVHEQTIQEDNILKMLKQQKGDKKWSEVADIMRNQYGIENRNGKQCRERYHNHLDQRISKLQWSQQEDQDLLNLHSQHGNRWAMIAREIKGRTDNCVKNRFYSRFRRSIRFINDFIKFFWKKQFKPLKPNIISKVIDMIQDYRASQDESKNEIFKACEDIKCRLISFSDENLDSLQKNNSRLLSLHQLIKHINEFNKKNKRRGKKRRRESSDDENLEDFCLPNKNKAKTSKISLSIPKNEQSPNGKQKTQAKQSIIEELKKQCVSIAQKQFLQKSTEYEINECALRFHDRSDAHLDVIRNLEERNFSFGSELINKMDDGFDINEFYSLENLQC